jgi:hypothetical protein
MKTRLALILAGFGILAGCDDASVNSVGAKPPAPAPAPVVPPAPRLRLDEVCPGNLDYKDERGEDPGWVEIRNLTDSVQSLGGMRLRGKGGDGPGWRLPDSSLEPGGRLLVFMSGLDRRRIAPPGDSVSLFVAKASVWTDSMNDPPGHSRWNPWQLTSLYGKLPGGVPAISAEMIKADNSGTDIEWSSVTVMAKLPGSKVMDVTGRDRLVLRATIPAGQMLAIRLCEEGAECWRGSAVQIKGTGVELDRYEVSLLGVKSNWAKLNGIAYEPPENLLGSYRFTVTDLWAYRSGLNPHASFELSRKGGEITLEDTSGLVTETVKYPEMPDDASWVRDSASGTFSLRRNPTPKASNPVGIAPALLPAPAFATASGFHAAPLVVQVGEVIGATVRCAEGGALPTASSPSVGSGIRLDSSAVVRCAAFAADGSHGPAATGTFLLGESVSLPVIVVTADSNALFQFDSGILVKGPNAGVDFPHFGANFWRDVEIPANIEMFEQGKRSFSLPAGIGIFGNYSRANDKKSLSVQFREEYGARRVEWPLFPNHPELRRFKGFALRNGGNNCGKDYVRDALMTSLTEGRNIEYQMSRHVVVFLNGKYWGIYELREKLDPDYLETRFGIDPSAVDQIKNGGEVQAGTVTHWNATVQQFMTRDLSNSAGYAQARELVDVDNYADYLATQIWTSNTDWPANNTRAWRVRSPSTPWRMMLFDLDFGLGSIGGQRDMLDYLADTSIAADGYPNGEYSTVFFRRLAANPGWRERFINRVGVLLSTNFSATRVQAALDSMQASIAAEVPRDQVRWKYNAKVQVNELKKMATFIKVRPGQVRDDFRNFFQLGNDAKVALSTPVGRVEVDGLSVGAGYAGTHFAGHALNLSVVAPTGARFVRWSDGVTSIQRRVTVPDSGLVLKAEFQ